ncbi:MAG: FkbM family methyltransferase [Nitrospira sp.]|nr:FkbM family methyltransferase [Nitrospira sp.]
MTPDSWLFKSLEFYGTRLRHRGQWKVHAMLRKWLQPNLDVDLEVTRDGHRWLLNPSDFVQTEFFWLGERDTWDILLAKRLIRPAAVLFDVGANFGHYAITLADALGRACEVHAFEPFPANAERLRTNIRLNGLERIIHVHPLGLADAAGIGKMMIRADNSGAATLAVTDEASVAAHNIELTTLDEFCERKAIAKIDFIKVDVEGFEERMILGSRKMIQRSAPTMLIEFDPPKLVRAGSSVDRLAVLLRQLGYGLWVADRDRLVPLKELLRGGDYINVFCLPDSGRSSTGQSRLL